MSKFLYSNDTTPENAAQISADTGEIVRVQVSTEEDAREYRDMVYCALNYANCAGDLPSELEVTGFYNRTPVRIHVVLP